MKPFRCNNCNKLLGMIDGRAEIVCPRCKTANIADTTLDSASAIKYLENSKLLKITHYDEQGYAYFGSFRAGWVTPEDRNKAAE